MRNHNTVRLLPLLDRIPFNCWNRFYHQDTPPPLQVRQVRDSKSGSVPAPPPGLISPIPPISHATVRTLPGKNASRPFLPRFSVARMLSSSLTSICAGRCVLSTFCGQGFVRAHLSTTMKWRITVSWWSEARQSSCPFWVVRSQKMLPIDELVPPSESPSSSLATPEDGGDLIPRLGMYLILFLVDPTTRLSFPMMTLRTRMASGPVDIILVDGTHSAVVYRTIPDGDNDVIADGEAPSMPRSTSSLCTISAPLSNALAPRSAASRPMAQ